MKGGLPEKLPVPYGEFASFSTDGSDIAYVPQTQSNRTWKRYRGGWASDIWRFNLKTFESKNLTHNPANDEFPMWHGKTIYFLSDRGEDERYNIWALDPSTGQARQVTHQSDYDITYPAIGRDDIVYQAGGRLYLLDLKTEKTHEVAVQVVTDRLTLKERSAKVAARINWAGISPSGKRAIFEARGDVFTVPQEHGPILNVTRSSGVAERYPRWSPDGKTLAFWSDRSGEYELTLRPADGSGQDDIVTHLGPGFRYAPYWSPDSTRVAFFDQASRAPARGREGEDRQRARQERDLREPRHAGRRSRSVWSADSRYLAWSRPVTGTELGGVRLRHEGRDEASGHLGVLQRPGADVRSRGQVSLLRVGSHVRAGLRRLRQQLDLREPDAARRRAAARGRPLAHRAAQRRGGRQEGRREHEGRGRARRAREASRASRTRGEASQAAGRRRRSTSTGFESRAVILPPEAGRYGELVAVKGKLLYRRLPRAGSSGDKAALVCSTRRARGEDDPRRRRRLRRAR